MHNFSLLLRPHDKKNDHNYDGPYHTTPDKKYKGRYLFCITFVLVRTESKQIIMFLPITRVRFSSRDSCLLFVSLSWTGSADLSLFYISSVLFYHKILILNENDHEEEGNIRNKFIYFTQHTEITIVDTLTTMLWNLKCFSYIVCN